MVANISCRLIPILKQVLFSGVLAQEPVSTHSNPVIAGPSVESDTPNIRGEFESAYTSSNRQESKTHSIIAIPLL